MATGGEQPIVVAVAYIGSDNSPLYFRNFLRPQRGEQEADSLELMLLLYGAMDQVDLHMRAAEKSLNLAENKSPEPYLGLLTAGLIDFEDVNVFGYMSASHVKVFVVVRDLFGKKQDKEDQVMRSLLRLLHHHFVDAACNPFYQGLGRPSFVAHVATSVDRHAARLAQLLGCAGIRLDCAAEYASEPSEGLLLGIGRLGALDILLNNMDRLPLPVWRNRLGNFGNIMVVSSGASVVGIDQAVFVIGDEAGRTAYLELVRDLLRQLLSDPEASPLSLGARLNEAFGFRCHTQLCEASLATLLRGLRQGLRDAAEAWLSGRLQEALVSVETEFEGSEEVLVATACADFVRLVAAEVAAGTGSA